MSVRSMVALPHLRGQHGLRHAIRCCHSPRCTATASGSCGPSQAALDSGMTLQNCLPELRLELSCNSVHCNAASVAWALCSSYWFLPVRLRSLDDRLLLRISVRSQRMPSVTPSPLMAHIGCTWRDEKLLLRRSSPRLALSCCDRSLCIT